MRSQSAIPWDNLDSRQTIMSATIYLARAARRTLHIYSRDLDAAIYDNDAFLDAATRLLTSSPRAEIRILVQDPGPAIRTDHRLIGLHQRLSSRLLIREPSAQHQDYNAAFLVADAQGVLYRKLADRFEADGAEQDRPRARQLIHYHEEVWEFARENPDLRRLHI